MYVSISLNLLSFVETDVKHQDLTEDDIKHELAEEELKSAKAGVPPLHETSACGFLSLALMIEDTQCVKFGYIFSHLDC